MTDRPLLRVALTGGIATGKSHCLATFASLGATVIDADVLARTVVGPGTAGHAAVRERFGPKVVNAAGEIDRARLADIVFADPQARRDLEAIIHPAVYAAINAWFDQLDARIGIADVPLLFETNRAADFDRVIVAACSPAIQRARLLARDGITEADARLRLSAQMPIDEKRRRGDYVIDTGGTKAETEKQVAGVWEELRQVRS